MITITIDNSGLTINNDNNPGDYPGSHQVDANQRDDSGASAILVAAEVGRHQVMRSLLARLGRECWEKAWFTMEKWWKPWEKVMEKRGKWRKPWEKRWKIRENCENHGKSDGK